MGAKEFHPQTDIYAIGILLYWMLSGKFPFKGTTITSTMMYHIAKNPDSLVANNPNVSQDLEAIVARTLAKDPRTRYASFNELSNDLKTVFDELSSLNSNKPKPKQELYQPVKFAIQNPKPETAQSNEVKTKLDLPPVPKSEEKKCSYSLLETASNFFSNLLKK